MFRSEKIFHNTVIIPKSKSHDLLLALQEKGVCQVKETTAQLDNVGLAEEEQKIVAVYSRLAFIKEQLEQYKPDSKVGIIKEFFSKKNPNAIENIEVKDKTIGTIEQHLGKVEASIQTHIQKINQLKEKQIANNFLISNLTYFPEIETDQLSDTDNIAITSGIISASSIELFDKELKKLAVARVEPIDKKTAFAVVLNHKSKSQEVEQRLHAIGFQKLTIPFENETPRELLKNLKEENQHLVKEENHAVKSLQQLYLANDTIFEAYSRELVEAQSRIKALAMLKGSDAFCVLEAWVPVKHFGLFKKTIGTLVKGEYSGGKAITGKCEGELKGDTVIYHYCL